MISTTSDTRAFARFIAPLQQDPRSHIAMVGTEELGIVAELEEFETRLLVEVNKTGAIVGAAGFDYDEPLQRGFLYGPWSVDDGWDQRADRLFEEIVAAVPAATKDLDIAFGKQHARAESFAGSHGFVLVRDHFTMGFARDDRRLAPDPDIREMRANDRAAVIALHERCFPETWPSGAQLLEQLEKGPDRRLFVLYEGDHLGGYHLATVDRQTGEAFVDNIGVDQRFRGRGFATRLLSHGLWWMFGFDEVTKIELSVRAENAAALQVYEKAGFRKLHAIRQMRKQLQPPA